MPDKKLAQSIYWGSHLACNGPGLFFNASRAFVGSRLSRPTATDKILIATHHKVLTVFLGRVFRCFAMLTNRDFSRGKAMAVDYSSSILQDDHSQFQLNRILGSFRGLHVRRDPRDLLVSATFYHSKSTESWLHQPDDRFAGKTYAEYFRSLPTLEEQLLFELDHSSGMNIQQMLDWNYERPEITELKYEQLLGDSASENLQAAIVEWSLSKQEERLLIDLFNYFSIGGPGVQGNRHVRNPTSGQWKKHFTPAVTDKFERLFPEAAERLGYES